MVRQSDKFYTVDCGHQNTCCSFNIPPWFFRELPQATTDDIEMRVCRDEDRVTILGQDPEADDQEYVVIEVIEVYVQ